MIYTMTVAELDMLYITDSTNMILYDLLLIYTNWQTMQMPF